MCQTFHCKYWNDGNCNAAPIGDCETPRLGHKCTREDIKKCWVNHPEFFETGMKKSPWYFVYDRYDKIVAIVKDEKLANDICKHGEVMKFVLSRDFVREVQQCPICKLHYGGENIGCSIQQRYHSDTPCVYFEARDDVL